MSNNIVFNNSDATALNSLLFNSNNEDFVDLTTTPQIIVNTTDSFSETGNDENDNSRTISGKRFSILIQNQHASVNARIACAVDDPFGTHNCDGIIIAPGSSITIGYNQFMGGIWGISDSGTVRVVCLAEIAIDVYNDTPINPTPPA